MWLVHYATGAGESGSEVTISRRLVSRCVLGGWLLSVSALADPLPRRLDYGWSLHSLRVGESGAEVSRTVAGGPAERAGVKVGDRILRIGEVSLDSEAALSALRFVGPADRPLTITLQRGTDRMSARITPVTAPRESHAGLSTEWGEIMGPKGLRLRTIVTAPVGTLRRTAVFVVGWLSCGSGEIPSTQPYSTDELIRDIVEHSGAVVLRVDKPGAGDSEGVCAETDFTTELEGYRRAFTALRQHPRVDPQRLIVLGISNGGGFAPLVPGDAPVAAYVTVGAWSKTWFEHMVDLERRRLLFSGIAASKIDAAMAALSEFHATYLFDQLTPAEVLRRRPHLQGVWYDDPESQYGRPAAYYHQLERLDLGAAWGRVRVPTLVVWGEYDWIMDRADQDQIVRLVNADGTAHASLLVVPRVDHGFGMHRDAQSAFEHNGEGRYSEEGGKKIIDFIQSVGASAP